MYSEDKKNTDEDTVNKIINMKEWWKIKKWVWKEDAKKYKITQ